MNGPAITTASSAIRPRKSSDWNDFRHIIERLYRNDQLKLKDVKEIMEREYNFIASEKQFKDRLAIWHIRKNIKANEREIMLRKQQKRAARGKQTAFRVGGHDVDAKRISRFTRRYSAAWNPSSSEANLSRPVHESSPEPDTPSDMSCYTPDPEDRSSGALSPATDILSDCQDDRLHVAADVHADDKKSTSEPLSPVLALAQPPMPQPQPPQQSQLQPRPHRPEAYPSTSRTRDDDALAQLFHFEEEMGRHIRQMDERIAQLRKKIKTREDRNGG